MAEEREVKVARPGPSPLPPLPSECPEQNLTLKDLTFSGVTKDNLQRVRALHHVIFPVSYNDAFYTNLLETGEFSKLAWHRGRLVAAVCCRVEPVKSGPGRRVYIMTLGCLAPYRRLGIGSFLLRYIVDLCQRHDDVRQLYLHVQISNQEALSFYRRFGFHVVDTMHDYYKRVDPPHAHVLSVNPHDPAAPQAKPSPPLQRRQAPASVTPRPHPPPARPNPPLAPAVRSAAQSLSPTLPPASAKKPKHRPPAARQALISAYMQPAAAVAKARRPETAHTGAA